MTDEGIKNTRRIEAISMETRNRACEALGAVGFPEVTFARIVALEPLARAVLARKIGGLIDTSVRILDERFDPLFGGASDLGGVHPVNRQLFVQASNGLEAADVRTYRDLVTRFSWTGRHWPTTLAPDSLPAVTTVEGVTDKAAFAIRQHLRELGLIDPDPPRKT